MRSPTPTDLFEEDDASALSAFERWAADRRAAGSDLKETTSAVQRSMWNAFSSWCLVRRISPSLLTASELDAYLRSREGSAPAAELTARYAWRLVRLIGQVASYMAEEQGLPPNRAAEELLETNRTLRLANDQAADPLPECLTAAEDRALVSFLESSVPREGKEAGLRWQDVRNRAAVSLQRGAGLTPMEVRTICVRHVHVDLDPRKGAWRVRAPATGSVREHDAPVARWARPLLAAWMQVRSELEIPGEWLFPSTQSGKQLGKTAHFEGSAQVLVAAGLSGPSASGGGYKLRNTFAVRQLAAKKGSESEIASWLGIQEVEIARYRSVLTAPVDVL